MNQNLNAQLHALLNQTGLTAQKKSLVFGFTNGRSDSSRDLTDAEAQSLVNYLRQQPGAVVLRQAQDDSANKQRRKIVSMAHELGWHNLVQGKWKVDMRGLNNWCVQHSYLKKELNQYTAGELPRLVSQFESMYKKYLNKV